MPESPKIPEKKETLTLAEIQINGDNRERLGYLTGIIQAIETVVNNMESTLPMHIEWQRKEPENSSIQELINKIQANIEKEREKLNSCEAERSDLHIKIAEFNRKLERLS